MSEGHDQDSPALDAVDHSVRVTLQQFAAVSPSNGLPKLRKGDYFLPRLFEFSVEVGGNACGPLLVKGHRVEDFQFGFEQMVDGYRFSLRSLGVLFPRRNTMKANEEKVIDPVEKAGLPTAPVPGGFRWGKGLGRRRILRMEKHGRRGTLWMDRYKSVLVQDGKRASWAEMPLLP